MTIRNQKWMSLIWISFLLLAQLSCSMPATKPPPPSCIRTYDFPDGAEALFGRLAQLFQSQGQTLINQIPSRGYFDTAWEYYQGRRLLWGYYAKRRKYEMLLVPEVGTPTRACIHFRLFVEEKAPWKNSPWKPRSAKALEDEAYMNFLQMMDTSVRNNGGAIH